VVIHDVLVAIRVIGTRRMFLAKVQGGRNLRAVCIRVQRRGRL
jgi:hypothetical protein